MGFNRVKLSPELVESFAGVFLSPMYDDPKPTPAFHRECWGLYCSNAPLAAIAAPRGHAKSMALTHDYVLSVVLFREQDYVVIVSATEELAMGHLTDIAKELRENEDITSQFDVKGLSTDTKSEIVVDFKDGHQCRLVAKGSGQRMRGMKWSGKRPGLILCDDLEDDEQTENKDRRERFRRWFYRALLPCRRSGGVVRMHGTILHEDALLARLMKASTWTTKLYRAHKSFDDFSEILWPEMWPENRLRLERQGYIDDGDAPGYSQEYLNDPLDNSASYLIRNDFIPMTEEDHDTQKMYAVGCDFAVSTKQKSDRTSFTVGGKCSSNLLHIVDQRVGRWSPLEWIDEMFAIQKRWNPVVWFVEGGVIWNALSPTVHNEMQRRNVWLNCQVMNPTKDKATRGRPLQKRMRGGGCRFDMKADWYAAYENELIRFTGQSDAVADDQFDSTATLAMGLENMADVEDDDFLDDDEIEMNNNDPRRLVGRSQVTGY